MNFDPATGLGAITDAVIAGLIIAAVVGIVARVRAPRLPHDPAARAYLADFATGLGQAGMGVRDAIDAFRQGVYTEPDSGVLVDFQREALYEGQRRVEEVEARLPRIDLNFRRKLRQSSRKAVEALRDSMTHLRAYTQQDGEAWSMEERDSAVNALERAQREVDRVLRAGRRA